jgi:hypothetical protein
MKEQGTWSTGRQLIAALILSLESIVCNVFRAAALVKARPRHLTPPIAFQYFHMMESRCPAN